MNWRHQGPPLLTWVDFNPSMNIAITSIIKCGMKLPIHSNFQLCSRWIMRMDKWFPHFTGHLITYLVKGAPGGRGSIIRRDIDLFRSRLSGTLHAQVRILIFNENVIGISDSNNVHIDNGFIHSSQIITFSFAVPLKFTYFNVRGKLGPLKATI